MQPTTKFKTKYVKMTRDPAKHAQALEDALNLLSSEGWNVTRIENSSKGSLVIAHRHEQPQMSGLSIPAALALFGIRPPGVDPEKRISPKSREIIHQVLHKLQEAPRGKEEEVLPSVVASVCRRYPNVELKTAAEELRALIALHRRNDHEDPNEKCPQSDQLETIAAALAKHVAQSVV
jgi:hypothetical protein